MNRNAKSGSAIDELGCSIEEFKLYLESKFEPWIKKTWNLDHRRPLASFDLSDSTQLKEACHYTNIQPMLSKANLIKSDKYERN